MASVPILRQGTTLIATIQQEMTDSDWKGFQRELLAVAGDVRARGAIIDVSSMDILDSYAGRAVSSLANMLRFRGVVAVVVGIQPDVALAMVQLGLQLEGVSTALDLEDGLELLSRRLAET